MAPFDYFDALKKKQHAVGTPKVQRLEAKEDDDDDDDDDDDG